VARGTAAREAAMAILSSARSGRAFEAAQAAAVQGLSDPDRRLTHEIAAGVLRHQTELDALLKPHIRGDWDRTTEDVKDVLRIGAYQLTRLDRIPAYAAVQTSVQLAKRRCGARPAALVNAVLRRVAETPPQHGRQSRASAPTELAALKSHPTWLVERWVSRFGLDGTARLLDHNNRRPPLVIQPVRWSLERLRDAFLDSRIDVSDAPAGAGLVVRGRRPQNLPGYNEGAFVVQDAAQAMLLRFADVTPGLRVWDACAAPGGKTAVLARRGPVIATEVNRTRIARLRQTLMRTGADVPIILGDARYAPVDPTKVDVTLLDAPCSATGTLARHPDGRWRLSGRSIETMALRQAALLRGAARAVRAGGLLVYLTCSLEPEENGNQIDEFLREHQAFERDRDDLFLFPPDTGTDGGFGARLRRVI